MEQQERQALQARIVAEIKRLTIESGESIHRLESINSIDNLLNRAGEFYSTNNSPQGSDVWRAVERGDYEPIIKWFKLCDKPLPAYGGEIEGFPEEFVKILLKEQFKSGNNVDITVFERNKSAQFNEGGFNHSRVTLCSSVELAQALNNGNFDFVKKEYSRINPEEFFDRELGSVDSEYTFSNSEITGQIAGYPRNVVVNMINNQVKQTGKADISIFQNHAAANKAAGGFNFQDTPEGAEYWCNVDAGDFSNTIDVPDAYVAKPKKKITRAKRPYNGKVKDYHGVTQDENKCIKIRDFWILKEEAVYMPDKTFEAPEFSFEHRGENYSMYDESFVYTKSCKFMPISECVYLSEERAYETTQNAIQLWLDYEVDDSRPQAPSGEWISRELLNKSRKYVKLTHGMAAGYAVLKSYTIHCTDIDDLSLRCEAFLCQLNDMFYLDKDLAPEPLTLAHIHDYHRSPDIVDLSDDSLLKIGFEIEKNSFNGKNSSGQRVSEHAIFKGLETDSSCGVEAITNILPLGIKGSSEETKTFELMDDAASIINEADVDGRCGGHISVSCKGMSANELFLRMRESMSVFYAIFRSRLTNQYCDSNHRIEVDKNRKYSPITIKDKWNTVEIRIPSRVRNVEQLKLRYQLMAIVADHSVNTDGNHAKLLKRVKPILVEMYKGNTSKVSKILKLTKHFREYILKNKVHSDISEYVEEYDDASETPAPIAYEPFTVPPSVLNSETQTSDAFTSTGYIVYDGDWLNTDWSTMTGSAQTSDSTTPDSIEF